jgi:hypothetical protein
MFASRRPLVVTIMGLVLAVGLVALHIYGPVSQAESYHHFADTRTLLSIRNAWNTWSNLPFLVSGAAGLWVLFSRPWPYAHWEKAAYCIFFLGVALTAGGSAYYHLEPTTERLFWDRLPMTLGFTSFYALWLGERLGLEWGRRLLAPLVLLGVVSMVQSRLSGDLRLYGIVQFFPVLTTPLLFLAPGERSHSRYVVYVILWYIGAKLLETFDAPIFVLFGGVMSGHALKHVAAAMAAAALVLRVRRLTADAKPSPQPI